MLDFINFGILKDVTMAMTMKKEKEGVEQAKQQLCMSITFFWYISLPSLRDYVKIMPYFLVHGGHKQAITKDTHE